MATVVARPLPESTDGATEGVSLKILILSSDFVGLYDQLEVWMAQDEAGPYEEQTAATWAAPRLPIDAGDAPASPITGRSVSVVGKTLTVRSLEAQSLDAVITFTGSDPLTLSQVAAQITSQGLTRLRSYIDATGVLVVESTLAGLQSIIRVVDGDAAPLLGLPVDVPSTGRIARPSLREGREEYDVYVPWASRKAFFKTRMRSRDTGAVSAFSQAFAVVDQSVGVRSNGLVLGHLDLVGIDGKPLADVEVTVFGRNRLSSKEGLVVGWAPMRGVTDAKGHVEFKLIRGLDVTVSISGAGIVRDITVPSDSSIVSFSLLKDAGATDDTFKVAVPSLNFAVKRTL